MLVNLPLTNSSSIRTNPTKRQGNWELDLKVHRLFWSADQYRIYGYEPNELKLNDEYFIINTTHPSDIERITAIINEALRKKESYQFKRRIIKKDGSFGFVETQANIIRSKSGEPVKIIGLTNDTKGDLENGKIDFNDPEFFNAFYLNYKRAITAEIYKWTFCSELAKDLCQEVFLKAWHNMSKYDSRKGELYTWLINIARNHCKDYLRSKYFRCRQQTQKYNLAAEQSAEEPESDLQHLVVRDLIFRLPLELREIVDLLFVQGFTQTDVAKLKNLPLGTVKSKSRTAITYLRDFLSAPQNAELKEDLLIC